MSKRAANMTETTMIRFHHSHVFVQFAVPICGLGHAGDGKDFLFEPQRCTCHKMCMLGSLRQIQQLEEERLALDREKTVCMQQCEYW
eukprot:4435286-Amphidinium_carterae.1